MTYAHAAARLKKAAEARVGLSMQLYLGGRARRQRSMRYGCMTRLSAHYARRTKRPLDVVQWLQVIAQQTQVAADQTASHPASHRDHHGGPRSSPFGVPANQRAHTSKAQECAGWSPGSWMVAGTLLSGTCIYLYMCIYAHICV